MYAIQNPNNRLNILELHRKINERNEKKSLCYEKVLEICNKRILAQTERDKTSCLFEFPEYVIGYPLFDLNMCIKYCEKHLIANGFLVKYLFPNKFYISWDFDEIKRHKEEERKKVPLIAVLPKQGGMIQNNKHSNNLQNHLSPNVIQSKIPEINNNTEPHNTPIMFHNSNADVIHNITNTVISRNPPISQSVSNNVIENTFFSQAAIPTTSKTLPQVSEELHVKMTQPLPTTLPKYDPFDLYSPSIHEKPSTLKTDSPQIKKNAIDNSFFANSFKQALTSGIGTSKIFDYKPSGKLTLNL